MKVLKIKNSKIYAKDSNEISDRVYEIAETIAEDAYQGLQETISEEDVLQYIERDDEDFEQVLELSNQLLNEKHNVDILEDSDEDDGCEVIDVHDSKQFRQKGDKNEK